MINYLTFTYRLVRADSFYIFYFCLAIGMGVIVGCFAQGRLREGVTRLHVLWGVDFSCYNRPCYFVTRGYL